MKPAAHEPTPPATRKKSPLLPLALLAVLLIGLGVNTVYRAAWDSIKRTDFTVYRNAGIAVLQHTDIYQAHNSRSWDYVYPPLFAIAMAPLAKLSAAWGSAIWYLLSILAIGYTSVMSVRMARDAGLLKRQTHWIYTLPLLLISPWLVSGITRGQASEVMILLVTASLYFSFYKRPWLAGLCLALAGLVKVFPLALLAWFLWQRKWTVIFSTFISLILFGLLLPAMVFGWSQSIHYWVEWIHIIVIPTLHTHSAHHSALYGQLLNAQKARNQSLTAALLTLHVPASLTRPVSGVIAIATLAAMVRWTKTDNALRGLFAGAAFLVWTLLIPPISESHYFGLLILPLTLLVACLMNSKNMTLAPRMAGRIKLLLYAYGIVAFITCFDIAAFELLRPLFWLSAIVWCFLISLSNRTPDFSTRPPENTPD